MKFTFYHFNFNVLDLERSIRFYDEALSLKPVREKASEDGSYKLCSWATARPASSWS